MSSGEEFPLFSSVTYSVYRKCCISFLSWHWLFQLVISLYRLFVSYLVDYHTVLLTNLSAIIWQQIVFVPLFLNKLLSSIKTIVPIVVNTSLGTRTISYTVTGKKVKVGEKEFIGRSNTTADSCNRGGMKKVLLYKEWKVPIWAKGGMHQKRLGTTAVDNSRWPRKNKFGTVAKSAIDS